MKFINLSVLFSLSLWMLACSQNPQLKQAVEDLKRERKILEEAYQAQQQKLQQLQSQIDEIKETLEKQTHSKLKIIHTLPTEKAQRSGTNSTKKSSKPMLDHTIVMGDQTETIADSLNDEPSSQSTSKPRYEAKSEAKSLKSNPTSKKPILSPSSNAETNPETNAESTAEHEDFLNQAFEDPQTNQSLKTAPIQSPLEQARSLAQQKQYAQAIAQYQQAIDSQPVENHPQIMLEKIDVESQYQPKSAIQSIQKLLYKHSNAVDSAKVMLTLSRLQIKLNQIPQAKATLQRLITLYPSSPTIPMAKQELSKLP